MPEEAHFCHLPVVRGCTFLMVPACQWTRNHADCQFRRSFADLASAAVRIGTLATADAEHSWLCGVIVPPSARSAATHETAGKLRPRPLQLCTLIVPNSTADNRRSTRALCFVPSSLGEELAVCALSTRATKEGMSPGRGGPRAGSRWETREPTGPLLPAPLRSSSSSVPCVELRKVV